MNKSEKGRSRKISGIFIKAALIALIILPIALYYPYYLKSYLGKPAPNTSWVSWYGDPQHEVYIGWETRVNNTCIVKWGESPDKLDNIIQETLPEKFHIVNITGLLPSTTYYYEIYEGTTLFNKGSFTTAPEPPTDGSATDEPFTFCMVSDTQQKLGPGWHSLLADKISSKNYSFIAFIGDFVEDGRIDEWHDFFDRAGPYLSHIPIVPVEGNHDRPRDGIYYFGSYFPNSVDNDTQFYFSFNWSNVHFQILYFPEMDLDDGIGNLKDYNKCFTPDHLEWLENDLRNAKDMAARITFFHCPITSSGFYGPNYILREQILPILMKYNVTFTAHGHAHHYERGMFKQDSGSAHNMTYFVVGTGGGLVDVALRPVNETAVTFASPAYVEVTVFPERIDFKAISLDDHILDTYEIPLGG